MSQRIMVMKSGEIVDQFDGEQLFSQARHLTKRTGVHFLSEKALELM